MIFECKDVTLGYENKVVAKNLNFKIDQGDYLCVVGENGTGKSTLIKTLLGLIKPLNGEVIANVQGKNHKGVGYLPQQTQAQKDFPASVWEVVLSGVLNNDHRCPFYNKKDKAEAEKNMEKLNILDLKKRCYRELSGGQQQRVLLARALCATDSVLILDEPVTGLDPAASMELYETIKDLNKKENVTIIMVSHDRYLIKNVCDRLLVMDGGRSTLYNYGYNEYLEKTRFNNISNDNKVKIEKKKSTDKKVDTFDRNKEIKKEKDLFYQGTGYQQKWKSWCVECSEKSESEIIFLNHYF